MLKHVPHFDTCLKQTKYFLHFFTLFWHFFQPSLAPKLSVYFFQCVGFEKLGYEHAFQSNTYSLRPFLGGGRGVGRPQALHRLKLL